MVRDTPAEANDRNHAGCIAFKVCDIVFRGTWEIKCDNLTLIILEIMVPLHLLDTNTLMCYLAQHLEALTLCLCSSYKIYEIVLTRVKFSEAKYARS